MYLTTVLAILQDKGLLTKEECVKIKDTITLSYSLEQKLKKILSDEECRTLSEMIVRINNGDEKFTLDDFPSTSELLKRLKRYGRKEKPMN